MKFYPCEYCEGDYPCKDCIEPHCFITTPCVCCEYGGKDVDPPIIDNKEIVYRKKYRSNDD